MMIRRITEQEMLGLIRGQCVPGNMKLNESLAGYLSRAFNAGADAQEELATLRKEFVKLSNAYSQLHEQYDLEVNPEGK